MKRYLANILKILILLAGFMFSLWVFMPWREVGRASMNLAGRFLEQRGMQLSWSDIMGLDDGFTINNLSVSGAMNISFESITLRPEILTSILSLAGVCNINFRGGNFRVGLSVDFGDGGFLLTASPNEILLEQLRTNGDFSLNGYMAINPVTRRITRADASVDVPDSFLGNMNMLRSFLPLIRDGNGRWHLRRQ